MPECIERETALKIIDSYAKTVTEDGLVVVNAVRDIVNIICPTADVESAKHGHWEYGEERNGSVYAYCTACHRKMNFNCYGYPHCPLCGAIMGGESND